MKANLAVSVPGEPDRHYPIDTRAIVGKGPTADVSIDGAQNVAAQHFRVKLGPDDVDVRLAPGARPLTYEGKPFAGGVIPYGSDFYLDRVRFSCATPKRESNRRVLPLLLAAAAVAGAFVVLVALKAEDQQSVGQTDESEVALFAEAAPPCPQTDPEGAARRALSLEKAALSKRERYRYSAHDGIDAGRLFARAGRCYEAAGDEAGRARVEAEGNAWRTRVTEEFQAARLRLRTALQNRQHQAALDTVLSMRRMLEGETLPYATWLAGKERQLRTQMVRSKKKKKKDGF